jgi:hypothetical protein
MGLNMKRGAMIYVPREFLEAVEYRKEHLNISRNNEAIRVLIDDADWGRAVKGVREGLKLKFSNKAKF